MFQTLFYVFISLHSSLFKYIYKRLFLTVFSSTINRNVFNGVFQCESMDSNRLNPLRKFSAHKLDVHVRLFSAGLYFTRVAGEQFANMLSAAPTATEGQTGRTDLINDS